MRGPDREMRMGMIPSNHLQLAMIGQGQTISLQRIKKPRTMIKNHGQSQYSRICLALDVCGRWTQGSQWSALEHLRTKNNNRTSSLAMASCSGEISTLSRWRWDRRRRMAWTICAVCPRSVFCTEQDGENTKSAKFESVRRLDLVKMAAATPSPWASRHATALWHLGYPRAAGSS